MRLFTVEGNTKAYWYALYKPKEGKGQSPKTRAIPLVKVEGGRLLTIGGDEGEGFEFVLRPPVKIKNLLVHASRQCGKPIEQLKIVTEVRGMVMVVKDSEATEPAKYWTLGTRKLALCMEENIVPTPVTIG